MVYLVYAICSEPRVPRSGPKAVRAKTACPLRKMHIRRIRKVRIVTELFQRGEINILIGTKSLLGEGWDSQSMHQFPYSCELRRIVYTVKSDAWPGHSDRCEKSGSAPAGMRDSEEMMIYY